MVRGNKNQRLKNLRLPRISHGNTSFYKKKGGDVDILDKYYVKIDLITHSLIVKKRYALKTIFNALQ